MREMAGSVKGASLIDLGSGAGFYARAFLAEGANPVFAVDRSAAMLSQLPDEVTKICADVEQVELESRFQRLVCAGLLEFLSDPARFLKRLEAFAVADAELYLLFPSSGFGGLLYRFFHQSHGISPRLFSEKHLRSLLACTRWELQRTQFVWPFTYIAQLKLPKIPSSALCSSSNSPKR
jgi:cyclopropane fatty-acyl-phospholipid synthase-like methyltransferase